MHTVVERHASDDVPEGDEEMWFNYDEPEPPSLAAPPVDLLRLIGTTWSVRILLHLAPL